MKTMKVFFVFGLIVLILIPACNQEADNHLPRVASFKSSPTFDGNIVDECQEFVFLIEVIDLDNDELDFEWKANELGSLIVSEDGKTAYYKTPDISFNHPETSVDVYLEVSVTISDGKDSITKKKIAHIVKDASEDISCN